MKATTLARTGGLAMALVIAAGCAIQSAHMSAVPTTARVVRPAGGKALVFFTRPSMFGGAIQATIYDGDTYIGTLSSGTHVAYETTPGTHLFMVIAESADFMRAELRPDKTYYAGVYARPGVWRARFSFEPFNGAEVADGRRAVEDTREMVVNDEGRRWAAENAPSIARKKNKYLPVWQQKPEQQTLDADSGT